MPKTSDETIVLTAIHAHADEIETHLKSIWGLIRKVKDKALLRGLEVSFGELETAVETIKKLAPED